MRKGVTLIEVILYVGFAVAILPVILYFLLTSIQLMTKNQVAADVERTAIFITQILTQTIRNADAVNYPLIGENSPALSLIIFSGTATTTAVFDLGNGRIQMREGAAVPFLLNSPDVVVSGLLF